MHKIDAYPISPHEIGQEQRLDRRESVQTAGRYPCSDFPTPFPEHAGQHLPQSAGRSLFSNRKSGPVTIPILASRRSFQQRLEQRVILWERTLIKMQGEGNRTACSKQFINQAHLPGLIKLALVPNPSLLRQLHFLPSLGCSLVSHLEH